MCSYVLFFSLFYLIGAYYYRCDDSICMNVFVLIDEADFVSKQNVYPFFFFEQVLLRRIITLPLLPFLLPISMSRGVLF